MSVTALAMRRSFMGLLANSHLVCVEFSSVSSIGLLVNQQTIAVGGGGAGGRSPPHSVQNVENRQKFGQMVNVFGQIVWIFGRTSAKIPS